MTQGYNLPGRIHKGNFNYSSQLWGSLERQLERHPQVKHLLLTGHSLGGVISTILGAPLPGAAVMRII